MHPKGRPRLAADDDDEIISTSARSQLRVSVDGGDKDRLITHIPPLSRYLPVKSVIFTITIRYIGYHLKRLIN